MGTKLGEAVVYLLGDSEGVKKALGETEKETEGWAGRLTGKLSNIFGSVVLGGIATVTAGIVGIGTAAFAAGMEYDGAMDGIRVSTGKTGDELDALGDDFKTVFTSIPTEAGPAAEVISELNRRLGLTGGALVDLSMPLLDMTRMLGGDAKTNAELFTRVMGDWGVSNDDAAETLDKMFVASQQTGVGVEGLMGKVVAFGSPLRLMGFSLDESIAMFAKWEKEGVNAELVMGSLRIAAGKFARDNVPLQEGLQNTIAKIQGMDNASEALALGMEVFGARAGPDMVAAIREGRFSIDELMQSMEGAAGAIGNAAMATEDFPEKLQVLKNTATVALAPLGLAFMDIVTTVVEKLSPALTNLAPVIETVSEIIGAIINTLVTGEEPLGDWSTLWEKLAGIFGEDVATAITDIIPKIQSIASTIGTFITEQLVPFVTQHAEAFKAAIIAIGAVLAGSAIVGTVTGIVTAIGGIAAAVGTAVASGGLLAGLGPIIAALGGPITLIIAAAAALGIAWAEDWGGIQTKTQEVIDWIAPYVEQFLADIKAWWAENGEQIIETVTNLWNTVRDTFNAGVEFIRNLINEALSWITSFWRSNGDEITESTSSLWQTVQNLFNAGVTFVRNLINDALSWMANFWAQNGAQIMATVAQLWNTVKANFTAALAFLKELVSTVLAALQRWWSDHKDEVLKVIGLLWENAKTAFTTAFAVLRSLVEAVLAAFRGDWTTFGEKLREIVDSIWNGVTTIFRNWFEILRTVVAELVQSIITRFTEIDWGEVGRGVIGGITNGIRNGIGSITDAARDAARAALDAAKGFLGISSPSTVMAADVGAPIIDGIVRGVEGRVPVLVDQIEGIARWVDDSLSAIVRRIGEVIGGGDGREGIGPGLGSGDGREGVKPPGFGDGGGNEGIKPPGFGDKPPIVLPPLPTPGGWEPWLPVIIEDPAPGGGGGGGGGGSRGSSGGGGVSQRVEEILEDILINVKALVEGVNTLIPASAGVNITTIAERLEFEARMTR